MRWSSPPRDGPAAPPLHPPGPRHPPEPAPSRCTEVSARRHRPGADRSRARCRWKIPPGVQHRQRSCACGAAACRRPRASRRATSTSTCRLPCPKAGGSGPEAVRRGLDAEGRLRSAAQGGPGVGPAPRTAHPHPLIVPDGASAPIQDLGGRRAGLSERARGVEVLPVAGTTGTRDLPSTVTSSPAADRPALDHADVEAAVGVAVSFSQGAGDV